MSFNHWTERLTAAALTTTTFVLLGVLPVQAQEPESQSATFRIRIEVQLPDKDLAERVAMYARNELRRLDDVEVVEEDPDYTLFFRVMEMKAGGQRIAHVLGIAVISYFPDGYFDSLLNPRIRNFEEITTKLEAVNVFEHQVLSISGPSEADLIETVVNAIATFDRGVLQAKRR